MKKPEVPFFVRFLEGQDVLQIRTDVKAGGGGHGGGGGGPIVPPPPGPVTMKYPSDDDENPAS